MSLFVNLEFAVPCAGWCLLKLKGFRQEACRGLCLVLLSCEAVVLSIMVAQSSASLLAPSLVAPAIAESNQRLEV